MSAAPPNTPEAAGRPPTGRFLAIALTLAAFAMSVNAIPPLATTMGRELNVRPESFGAIFMLQFVCFFLASLAGGWTSRHSRATSRRLVQIGLFTLAAVFAAGPFLSTLIAVTAWIIPVGLCGGLIETFGSIMITDLEGRASSKLVNLSQMFYCLGAIIAPQLASILLAGNMAWRHIFVFIGSLIFLIGVLFTAATRPGPAAHGNESRPQAADRAPDHHPLRDRMFYLLAAFLFMYVAIEGAAVCWVPLYFEKHLGVTPSAAAWRLAALWGGVLLGRALVLLLPHRWTLWPTLLTAAAGVAIGTTLVVFGRTAGAATGLLVLDGVAMGPVWPVTVAICKSERDCARFTSGVIGTGALGVAFGPFLASWVIQRFGPGRLFPVLAAACLLLVAAGALARREKSLEARSRKPIEAR